MPDVVTYQDVLRSLRGQNTVHALLGNGFSIGCDRIFRYESLYETAVTNGLSARAQAVFVRLGTNNFEGVLRLLEDFRAIGSNYDLTEAGCNLIAADIQTIKDTLVGSIAASHLTHAALVSDEKKNAALAFLQRFRHVYTTNYDLLLYWTILIEAGRPSFIDGFHGAEDDPDANYVIYSEPSGHKKGIFYLHGALHIYDVGGELRKHCWTRTRTHLTELIRDGLARGEYPLFVAEGNAEQKLAQISRHGYLSHCFNKFSRLEAPVVIYGHSLGRSDNHLVEAMTQNPNLERIYVGLHGNPESAENAAIIAAAQLMVVERQRLAARYDRFSQLDTVFYQAETASVWGGR